MRGLPQTVVDVLRRLWVWMCFGVLNHLVEQEFVSGS